VIGREKVWSLPFADDLVILAKREREMKEIMKCVGKYVGKKNLEDEYDGVEKISGPGKEGK
jgi:hypothetical protein